MKDGKNETYQWIGSNYLCAICLISNLNLKVMNLFSMG